MPVHAKLRYFRISPRKARKVVDLIRGKSLDQALQITRFTQRSIAGPVHKLLKSAMANADQQGSMDLDNLYVKTATVESGPTMKRITPRAQGRATPIRKRTSTIKIVLDER
jgi:large subunit ribosomal protein L22